MIRIAYDYQVFGWQEYGGVSRYLCELAARIPRLAAQKVQVIAPLYANKYLRDDPGIRTIGRYVPHIRRTDRIRRKINHGLSALLLSGMRPDLVHETYYNRRGCSPRGTKTVVTVHDMIHELFPESFDAHDPTRGDKRAAIQRADHLICVSRNTQKDLIDILGVEPSRTSVVYHGHSLGGMSEPDMGPLMERPYIAYVGSRSGYKNFVALLRAYASSTPLQENFSIVCFGGGPFSATEITEIRENRIRMDRIVQISGNDKLLGRVYRHATAFVYPSLYEGFGIPPLEAMAQGCPVICSSTSSLPEVCGDAVEYCDPYDPESLRAALEHLIESPTRRKELISAGYERSKLFSWDRCAQDTAGIYARLV